MRLSRALAAAAAAVLFASPVAHASTERFMITWSGAPYGNAGTATGEVTLDTALVGTGMIPISAIDDLTITVRGTIYGDGTFTKSDFSRIDFAAPGALDLTRELIGQPLGNGHVFGDTGGLGGDFNIFGIPAVSLHVPAGTGYFQMVPDEYGGNGVDPLRVTSIAPLSPVPEASEAAMSITGLALLLALAQRRRTFDQG
jgi:hypothetical protein